MIRFGVFEVDRRAGELRRNGARVKLQEQPFQILALLLERPGEVVSREELQGRLWPADTFVDFDHSLNAAIRRLRDALGDSAENPRFVETVARRGDRFLATVSGPIGAARPLEPPRLFSDSMRRWLVLGGIAFALVVGAVLGWHAAHSAAPIRTISERRLTANAAELPVTDGVISPDGRYLAFTDGRVFTSDKSIQERRTRSPCQPGSMPDRGAGFRTGHTCWPAGSRGRKSRRVSG